MIKKKWGIAIISAILIFILSTPIMAATIMGGEDDDETSNVIDTTTDNDFVDNAHATLEQKIKEEIKTQLIWIGESAYADIDTELYNKQKEIQSEIKEAWAQSINQTMSDNNLYDIYERYSDSVTQYGYEKVDAWINNYYETYVEVITDKVVEYINGDEGLIINGVSNILHTSTGNLKEEMENYVTETRNTLNNIIRETLPKYSTSLVGWENKAAEAIMLEADINIKDKAEEVLETEYGWENNLLNEAFNAIKSPVTDISNDFVDKTINDLKGYLGGDYNLDIKQIILDYMMDLVMGEFNTTWSKIESILHGGVLSPEEIMGIEDDLENIYNNAEDMIKHDVEISAGEFVDDLTQAVDEKFSNFGNEVAEHLANIAGEIASDYAMYYYIC